MHRSYTQDYVSQVTQDMVLPRFNTSDGMYIGEWQAMAGPALSTNLNMVSACFVYAWVVG